MVSRAKYVYTFEDYVIMVRGVRSKSPWARWAFLGAAPVALAIAVFNSATTGTSLYQWLALCSLAVLAIGVAWRLPISMRLGFKRCSLSGKTVAYQLTDEGVSWTADERSGTHPWPTITAAEVNPNSIVLVIGKYAGIVLPARAFPSRLEFESAVEFVREKTRHRSRPG
jgi:YcxB-like protein